VQPDKDDLQRRKKKKPPLRIFENFCQHIFAKLLKPTYSPSFAKKHNLANPLGWDTK